MGDVDPLTGGSMHLHDPVGWVCDLGCWFREMFIDWLLEGWDGLAAAVLLSQTRHQSCRRPSKSSTPRGPTAAERDGKSGRRMKRSIFILVSLGTGPNHFGHEHADCVDQTRLPPIFLSGDVSFRSPMCLVSVCRSPMAFARSRERG